MTQNKYYLLIVPKLGNNCLGDKFPHNWRCTCDDCEMVWNELKLEVEKGGKK